MPRLSALVALLLLCACSKESLDGLRVSDRRVLLLGIDGLDYDIIRPIVESGDVPRLAELRRRGFLVDIQGERASIDPFSVGLDPAQSWSTIATGFAPMNAAEGGTSHGVRSVTVPVAGSYDELPITSQHRQVPAFWDVLSAAGVRCAIVGWWTTWPAEPVNGAMVTDRFFLEKFGLTGYGPAGRVDLPVVPDSYRSGARYLAWPEELETTLPAEVEPALRNPKDPVFQVIRDLRGRTRDAKLATQLRQLEQALRTDLAMKEATLALLKRDPSIQFATCYFDAVDVASHWFWRFIDPLPWHQSKDKEIRDRAPRDPRDPETSTLKNMIPLVVLALDRMVAELCDAMGPETVVLIVTDHTLEPDVDPYYNRDFDLDGLLEQVGLLARAPDGSIDWSRTTCFDRTRWQRLIVRRLALNEKGVWPQGIVEVASPQERVVRWRGIQKQLQDVEARWKANDVEHDELFMDYRFEEGGDAFFTVMPQLPSFWPVKLPAREGVAAIDTTFGQLFPLRPTAARHPQEPGMLLVAYPGEAGEKQGRRDVPMGKGPGISRNVAPLVLALFGIPCSEREDESPPNADFLYWVMPPDEAQRMTLMPRVESYEAAVRFRDPTSPLGARRAELRKYVAGLGYEFSAAVPALDEAEKE